MNTNHGYILNTVYFSCWSTPPLFLKIHFNSHPTFVTLLKYLKSTSVDSRSFLPHYMRRFMVVIRNLRHSTILTDVSDAQAELQHSIPLYTCDDYKKNQRRLPLLLLVELVLDDINQEIFNFFTLSHIIVVIEKPHVKINDLPRWPVP